MALYEADGEDARPVSLVSTSDGHPPSVYENAVDMNRLVLAFEV